MKVLFGCAVAVSMSGSALAQSIPIKKPSEFLTDVREVGAGLEADYGIPIGTLVGESVDAIESGTGLFGIQAGDVDAVPGRVAEVLRRFGNGDLPRATPQKPESRIYIGPDE